MTGRLAVPRQQNPDHVQHTAWLSLGSNIAPRENLPRCVSLLREFGKVEAVSSAWCSPSAGDASQPDFLNAAVLLRVELSPGEILSELIPQVEAALDRVRDPENVNAARTIDVDLSLYDDFVGHVGRHRLPDPDILTRAFVAVPLAELNSGYLHPVDGQSLGEIAAALLDAGQVLRRDSLDLRLPLQSPGPPLQPEAGVTSRTTPPDRLRFAAEDRSARPGGTCTGRGRSSRAGGNVPKLHQTAALHKQST